MATRIIHTHDTETNWSTVPQLVPKKGEIIVYDADSVYSYPRFKIGDGSTLLSQLPFVFNNYIQEFLNYDGVTCYADGGRISDYPRIPEQAE